jgi:hypothetical protein
MNRIITLGVVLLLAGPVTGTLARGDAAAQAAADLPGLSEKIRKGQIDVGTKPGMASDQRYHRIHADALAIECGACHVEKFPRGAATFAMPPAVDLSPDSPAPIERRVCLGCHVGGVAAQVYGP